MNPETFQDKLHAAAVCHNMGVINRRTGKTYEAVQSFEDSLDIYNECVVYYNYLCESITNNNESSNRNNTTTNMIITTETALDYLSTIESKNNNLKDGKLPSSPSKSHQITPICLELKIAQTLQSMARLYTKHLDDSDSAIKAHEDAINLLVHGKFILDDVEEAEESYWRRKSMNGRRLNQMSSTASSSNHSDNYSSIMYDGPQRQERISRHYNLYNEYNDFISPKSIMGGGGGGEAQKNQNAFTFPDISEYNVVKLTDHERIRVITASLNALAGIYGTDEMQEYDIKQKKFENEGNHNSQSDKWNDNNNDEDSNNDDIIEKRFLEDPLQYYQQALAYLRQMPNLASQTLIPALSNDNKTIITNANDAALTITTLSPPMTIDLRKDISSTLMQMGELHMQRENFASAVQAFEEARDIRRTLCRINFEMDDEYVESVYKLGLAYQKRGFPDKALPCFQIVMKTKRQTCGTESMEVANLYCEISNTLRLTENMADSLSYIKRAIAVYKRNKECFEEKEETKEDGIGRRIICKCIIGALKNCASLYMKMEEVPMAIQMILEIVEVQKEMDLEDHPDFAVTMNILGELYFTNNELEKAKSSFGLALSMYREFGLGEHDPDFIMTMNSMNEIDAAIVSNFASEILSSSCSMTSSKETTYESNSILESTPSSGRTKKNLRKINKSPKNRYGSKPNNQNLLDNKSENGMEIVTFTDNDDVVSNITFSTKKNASDYVYEGVLSMSKAMENVASAAEELFAGSPARLESKSPSNGFIFPSKLEYLDETSGQVLDDEITSSILETNTERKEDDLSEVLGSYPTQLSVGRSRPSSVKRPPRRISSESASNSNLSTPKHGMNSMMKATSDTNSIQDDTSTLFGTSFVNNESVNGSIKEDASTLYGATFVNSISSSVPDNINQDQTSGLTKDSHDLPLNASFSNIDDLLAQMNVVTNDMDDEVNATPFRDILGVESSEFDASPDYSANKRKNFQRLSNCLDTLDALEEKYGYGHIKSLDTLQTLADIYLNNGDKQKGINTLIQVANVQKKKFGENHLEVANTYIIIAKLYKELKNYTKAADNYTNVKDIEEYLYGNTDPRIALTLNKIGEMELSRGDFDLAMDRFQEALKIQRIYLAPNEINPDLSQTLVNIGSVYYKERNSFNKIKQVEDTYQKFIESGKLGEIAFAHSERGEYVKATHFYGELLELLKNRGQSDHGVVTTLNHLGSLNIKLGRYVVALSYHKEALSILESLHDAEEVEICEGKVNIGVVDYKSGNFARAIEIIEREASKMKELLGNDHHKVAKAEFHLGVIRRILCQYDKALSHLESAYTIQMRSLQKHHPDTMSTQLEIGRTNLDLYQIDVAVRHFNSLLQNQLDVLGKVHPDIALTHLHIGICYARKGEIKLSTKSLRRSYRMYYDLQIETPEVARLREEIGYTHLSREKYDRAAIVFQDSLRIRRDCIGEDHYEIAYSMLNLGVLFTEKLEFQQAMSCFNEAESIAVRTFGLQHPLIGDIHLHIGKVHQRRCNFDEAKREISWAIKIYKLNLSSTHAKIISASQSLERVDHEEQLCV